MHTVLHIHKEQSLPPPPQENPFCVISLVQLLSCTISKNPDPLQTFYQRIF